jgi:hypothetical protein
MVLLSFVCSLQDYSVGIVNSIIINDQYWEHSHSMTVIPRFIICTQYSIFRVTKSVRINVWNAAIQ